MSHDSRGQASLLCLVGAPGAGKTSVGAALARRLDWDVIETDALVAQSAGLDKASTVMTERGEQAFRALEANAVGEALERAERRDPGAVVAIGSGAVSDPAVREALVGLPVVWLRVTAPNAASRVGLNAIRPVALGNIRAQFAAQLRAREPWYDEVSTWAVETDHRSIDDIAGDILAWRSDFTASRDTA